ncbi:MAG: IS66 family insertion sequence element accessory protein TnpB [Betaproteobacteria bacterium]|nr:IS66 family insertion sequence element accessory protein TnpB [Betaproteobacteria bacterium]
MCAGRLRVQQPPARPDQDSAWDRNGFWLLIKRLEADRFKWPKGADLVELTVEQLHWLLEGINLSAMQPHPARNYQRVG